ncbi:MAG: NifB/NifX family molybdenum-iron cluster-binding protein [Desulfohalobiaceae bacterium]
MSNEQTIALCLRQGRIAPRLDHPEILAVYTLDESLQVIKRREHPVQHLNRVQICNLLSALHVQLVICGGILQECRHILSRSNILCLDNIIGSEDLALVHYQQGRLQSGMVLD